MCNRFIQNCTPEYPVKSWAFSIEVKSYIETTLDEWYSTRVSHIYKLNYLLKKQYITKYIFNFYRITKNVVISE